MASIVFEVECECEGVVRPAEYDVGIMGPWIEDADLSSVSMLKWVRGGTISGKKPHYQSIDILDGLDKAARQIVIANIMKTFATEVDEAILSDV